MSAPILYHVDRFDAFNGDTSHACRSPADEPEVWLNSEGATLEAPPNTADDEVAVIARRLNASTLKDATIVADSAEAMAAINIASGWN